MVQLIVLPIFAVGYVLMRCTKHRRGQGRAWIAIMTGSVFIALALTTAPLFAIAATIPIAVATVLGIYLNRRIQHEDSSRYIRW